MNINKNTQQVNSKDEIDQWFDEEVTKMVEEEI